MSPVIPGKSRKVVSENIKELHTGKTHARTQAMLGKKRADKQSIAIALNEARRSVKSKTKPVKKKRK